MIDSELTIGAGHGALSEASPYGLQSKKLAMWLFIASDAVTFTAALVAYGFLRIGSPDWPRPFEWPSIANGLVITFVLLSSSVTMLVAVRAAKAGQKSKAIQWLGFTMLLGVVFVALHLREWFHMLAKAGGCTRIRWAARSISAPPSSYHRTASFARNLRSCRPACNNHWL